MASLRRFSGSKKDVMWLILSAGRLRPYWEVWGVSEEALGDNRPFWILSCGLLSIKCGLGQIYS